MWMHIAKRESRTVEGAYHAQKDQGRQMRFQAGVPGLCNIEEPTKDQKAWFFYPSFR
jgi:hypothetical protein